MATDNNIKHFTATDIERYHRGLLSAKERHALEKAALDDPFLADALEGYAVPGVNASADLSELQKRLEERTERTRVIPLAGGKTRSFPWLRAAAAIVILAGAGYLAYQFAFTGNEPNSEIAKTEPGVTQQKPASDSPAISGNETTSAPSVNADKQGTIITDPPGLIRSKQKDAAAKGTDTVNNNAAVNYYTPEKSPSDGLANNRNAAAKKDLAVAKPVTAPVAEGDLALTTKEKPDKDRAEMFADSVAATNRADDARAKARVATANRNNQAYRNQSNIFRGRVTDNNNNGIPFANVTNVEDNVGTYTDARGYFNLTSPDSVLSVQTRALGFNSYNVQLRNNIADNRVVMQEDQSVASQTLSEKKVNYERRSRDAANFKLEGEPEPEDGWEDYDSYLANNVNIPQEFKSRQTEVSRTVEVSFEVNKNGEPVNFKVIKSLCSKCDEEAIRLIKQGPKWKRKARKGRTTVAISF